MIDGLSDFTFVIPARKGSKGFPYKNRLLIDYTIDSIPKGFHDKIIITTDDDEIMTRFSNLKIVKRSKKNSSDFASTREALKETKPYVKTDNIVMLYLTYPERTFENIVDAINFFKDNRAKSLLCKKEIEVSPYLMMYDHGLHGKQIIKHDLHRRQDYQKCFEISHFISIMKLSELEKLGSNLYNERTIFYPIKSVTDVDLKEDLQKYVKNKNNC